jgi:hypothetical protein
MAHSQALLAAQVTRLEKATKAASEREQRIKERIQKGGDLSKAGTDKLLAQEDVEAQLEEEMRKGRLRTGTSRGRKRRCKIYREEGHNSRKHKKDFADNNE